MKKSSSSKASKTKLKRVRAMKDRDIEISAEHPEADVKHIVKGIVRRGLKPAPPKKSISLRIDADVLEWYKAQGPGYRT
ncbi:MAG: BrnA antitoxin family protein, partial [Methyloligellaceae bacterium]